MNKKKIKLPEPEEGIDFYIDELRRYTITIEIEIDSSMSVYKTDSEIRSEAIRRFREGSVDGNTTIVHSEKMVDIKLNYNTGMLFNREAWQKSKCSELGYNMNGTLLRPWEKEQPKSQTTIEEMP